MIEAGGHIQVEGKKFKVLRFVEKDRIELLSRCDTCKEIFKQISNVDDLAFDVACICAACIAMVSRRRKRLQSYNTDINGEYKERYDPYDPEAKPGTPEYEVYCAEDY